MAQKQPVKFPPGRLAVTPGAIVELAGLDPKLGADQAAQQLLARHLLNDWGDLDAHDKRVNDLAVRRGGRILSNYKMPNGEAVWIITEADRSVTTILSPSEY